MADSPAASPASSDTETVSPPARAADSKSLPSVALVRSWWTGSTKAANRAWRKERSNFLCLRASLFLFKWRFV